MAYHLRPFNPNTDFPRQADILNTFEPIITTVALLCEQHRNRPNGAIWRQIAAVDGNGYLVGDGIVICPPWSIEEGRFYFAAAVDPGFRRQGIGRLLYDDLHAFAIQNGAKWIETLALEALPEARIFAEKCGFVVLRHYFDGVLDITTFDATPFADVIETVQRGGIRFFSYAEIEDTPENRHRLYDLEIRLMRDVPGYDFPDDPYEKWVQRFEKPEFMADAQVLAADGDHWIGLATLEYFKEDNIMHNGFTAVDPAYRGRNIALALKLRAIECAQKKGVPQMRTNNDALNAPMLAINRKLGYQEVPGVYRMKKAPA